MPQVSVILIGLAGFILLESRHLSFGTMRVPQTAFFPKILAVLLLISVRHRSCSRHSLQPDRKPL